MAKAGSSDERERRGLIKRIREMMLVRDMSQNALARRLGVSPATVSEWFNKGAWPSGQIVMQLPRALHCSERWLLTGRGSAEPNEAAEASPQAYVRGGEGVLALLEHWLQERRDALLHQREAGRDMLDPMALDTMEAELHEAGAALLAQDERAVRRQSPPEVRDAAH